MKYVCKHKNIADELKKRSNNCIVEIKPDLESLIYMHSGTNDDINLCFDVLKSLGYMTDPSDDVDIDKLRLTGDELNTIGAYK